MAELASINVNVRIVYDTSVDDFIRRVRDIVFDGGIPNITFAVITKRDGIEIRPDVQDMSNEIRDNELDRVKYRTYLSSGGKRLNQRSIANLRPSRNKPTAEEKDAPITDGHED